jgi:predicted secreted protein
MSISLIIFIIIHVLVFAFVVEMIRRIASKNKEYPLDETKETLPFGFLRLRYVILTFIITYVLWVIFSLWLYGYFVGDFFSGTSTVINNNSPF